MEYRFEQPLGGVEAAVAHEVFIGTVCDWLDGQRERAGAHHAAGGNEPAPHGDFAAVFGGRGSGKSSVLNGLRYKLEADKKFSVLSPFKPEELPEDAELVSALVLHLEGSTCAGGGQAALGSADGKIWEALAERRKPGEFQRFEEQLATSQHNYRDRLVDAYKRYGGLHNKLKLAVREWIDNAARGPGVAAKKPTKHFVLLIDDLDLVHHRAWDLLDCLHHCFRHPRLTIIVFADEPLLLEGLSSGLLRADRNIEPKRARSLAGAMSLKLLPARFAIPSISPSGRLERLKELGMDRHAEPLPERVTCEAGSKVSDFWELWHVQGDRAAAVEDWLGRILPDNSREIKALRNRWVLAQLQGAGSGDDDQRYRLGFLLEAIDLQHPGIDLVWLASEHVAEWQAGFGELTGTGGVQRGDELNSRNLLLVKLGSLPPEQAVHVRALLLAVRSLMDERAALQTRRLERLQRGLLHVSLYEPRAGELAEVESSLYRDHHTLDLSLFRPSGGAAVPARQIAEIIRAINQMLRQPSDARALELPSISILSAAPASVHAYLGWRLRRLPIYTFVNQFAGEWRRYIGSLQLEGSSPGAPLWRYDHFRYFAKAVPEAEDLAVVLSTRADATDALDRFPAAVRGHCALGTVAISAVPYIPPAPEGLPDQPWSVPEHLVDRDSDAYNEAMVLPRLVWQARDLLRGLRQRQRTGTLHLAIAAPAPFAFFLGGHLHALQPIQLYEFENGSYVPSIRIRDGLVGAEADVSSSQVGDTEIGGDGPPAEGELATPTGTSPGSDEPSSDAVQIAIRRGLDEE